MTATVGLIYDNKRIIAADRFWGSTWQQNTEIVNKKIFKIPIRDTDRVILVGISGETYLSNIFESITQFETGDFWKNPDTAKTEIYPTILNALRDFGKLEKQNDVLSMAGSGGTVILVGKDHISTIYDNLTVCHSKTFSYSGSGATNLQVGLLSGLYYSIGQANSNEIMKEKLGELFKLAAVSPYVTPEYDWFVLDK